MSGKKYYECSICGAKYEACYSCNKKNPSLSWKNVCDTAEHYKIFQIVNGYTAGMYTKEEAANKFKNVDLSDLESLRDNIKDVIKSIRDVTKRKVKSDSKSVTSVASVKGKPVVGDVELTDAKSVDTDNDVKPVVENVVEQVEENKQTGVN